MPLPTIRKRFAGPVRHRRAAKTSAQKNNITSDILKMILPAVIALLGVAFGSVLTFKFSTISADREYERKLQESQLERKLRLYERASRLQQKVPEMKDLYSVVVCNPQPACALKQGLTSLDATRRLSDFKAERNALKMETLLVFGDNVAKVVLATEEDKDRQKLFFDGLEDELNRTLGAMFVEFAKDHSGTFSWAKKTQADSALSK